MRFDVRVVTVAGSLRYDPAEWRDALVLVFSGELDLDGRLFGEGSVLALARLRIDALRQHGARPAVLVAVTRPAPPGGAARSPPGLPSASC